MDPKSVLWSFYSIRDSFCEILAVSGRQIIFCFFLKYHPKNEQKWAISHFFWSVFELKWMAGRNGYGRRSPQSILWYSYKSKETTTKFLWYRDKNCRICLNFKNPFPKKTPTSITSSITPLPPLQKKCTIFMKKSLNLYNKVHPRPEKLVSCSRMYFLWNSLILSFPWKCFFRIGFRNIGRSKGGKFRVFTLKKIIIYSFGWGKVLGWFLSFSNCTILKIFFYKKNIFAVGYVFFLKWSQ